MLCVLSCCHVRLFVTPWTVAHQAPLSLGMLQARMLEWVAMPFSKGSSQPRDQNQVSRTAGGFFTIWATREAQKGDMKSVKVKVTKSCPTLCNPVDYIVHWILQAGILEWVVYPFSSRSSLPRNWTGVSCTAGGFFTNWAMREAL